MMTRTGKIGSGTYSTVYSAETPKGTQVALKRVQAPSCVPFYGNPAELSAYRQLPHPYIIDVYSLAFGEPFLDGVMTPIEDIWRKSHPLPKPPTPEENGSVRKGALTKSAAKPPPPPDIRDDDIHYVFPLADQNLFQWVRKQPKGRIPPAKLPKLAAQILLAVEYTHARGFIHRDLKSENVLMFGDEPKLADYGLVKLATRFEVQTPGVQTVWYRAPEVCLEHPYYGLPADIWSVGCIFYELFTGGPLTGRIKKDISKKVIEKLLTHLPYTVSISTAVKMCNPKQLDQLKDLVVPPGRPSVEAFLGLTPGLMAKLDKYGGTTNFVELMLGLLSFDVDERWTASQALDSSYFDGVRELIEQTRAQFPPQKPEAEPYQLISGSESCIERKWMRDRATSYFKHRRDYSSWYSHAILFLAIHYFDTTLIHLEPDADTEIIPSKYRGRLLTREWTAAYFMDCIYLAIRVRSSLKVAVPLDYILPKRLRTDEAIKVVRQFDEILVRDVLKYVVMHETLYDVLVNDHKPSLIEVESLLKFVLNGWHKNRTPVKAFAVWKRWHAQKVKEKEAAARRKRQERRGRWAASSDEDEEGSGEDENSGSDSD